MQEKDRDENGSSSSANAPRQAANRYPVSDDQLRSQVLNEYANACETVGAIVRRAVDEMRDLEPEAQLDAQDDLADIIRRFTKIGDLALAVL